MSNAKLSIDINAKSNFEKAAQDVSKSINKMGHEIQGSIASYLSFEAAKAGIEALIGGLGDISHASERLGMEKNVEEFQKFVFAADKSGSSLEKLEMGWKKMEQAIGEAMNGDKAAIDKFNGIGLSIKSLSAMTPDKQFTAIAEAIRSIETPAQRTAALIAIFGKSGTSLLPMIENLERLKKEAVDVGAVIEKDIIESAHKAEVAFKTLGTVTLATFAESGLVEKLKEISEGFLAITVNAKKAEAIGGKKTGFWEKAGMFMADTGARFVSGFQATGAEDLASKIGLGKKLRPDTFNVTDEEKKKLADAEELKKANSGKTVAQINEQKRLAEAVKVENEQRDIANKYLSDGLDLLNQSTEAQSLKNEGLSVEEKKLKFISDVNKKMVNGKRELTADEQSGKAFVKEVSPVMQDRINNDFQNAQNILDLANATKIQEKLDEKLTALKEEQAIQELLNQGKEKEAAIQKEIYSFNKDARAAHTTISSDVQDKIVAGVGQIYETDKATKENKKSAEVTQSIKDTIEALKEQRQEQDLINSGKEKEAFIEKELSKVRKEAKKDNGRDLTADETKSISDEASKFYDSQQLAKNKYTVGQSVINDKFTSIGGLGGKILSASDGVAKQQLSVEKEGNQKLDKIYAAIKEQKPQRMTA